MHKKQTSEQIRVMAVSFSSRGFGYAVIEGENTLLDFGRKRIYGDKNAGSLAGVEKVIARSQPDILVLQDANRAKGTRRVPRIKELHKKVTDLAKEQQIKAVKIAGRELRDRLLGNEDGTKQEMAELLAKQFPDELESLLPPKREAWMNADFRMDIILKISLIYSFLTVAYSTQKSTGGIAIALRMKGDLVGIGGITGGAVPAHTITK